jgi:FkbM family methyltransferase
MWRREIFFRVASMFTPTVEAVWPSGRFLVSTHDRAVSRTTFVDGPFGLDGDIFTCRLIGEVLGARFDLSCGDVLEAGANIGTGTVSFVTVLGARRVHAFEPAPDNVRLLRLTVAANGLDSKVVIHASALSNAVGVVKLELAPGVWGDHRVRVGPGPGTDAFEESARSVLNVPALTVDAMVEAGALDLDDFAIAWIDVQGHEGALLEGARSLLETDIPVVIEFWPYGLKRARGLETFIALAQQHYSHFLNVNDAEFATDSRATRDRLESTAALANLSCRYLGPDDHTNLVLFSLA